MSELNVDIFRLLLRGLESLNVNGGSNLSIAKLTKQVFYGSKFV